MTDRELLEAAAKAAGYVLDGLASRHISQGVHEDAYLRVNERGGHSVWFPIGDDGDALRLAVKLGMEVYIDNHPSGCECSEAQSHTHKTPENQARSCINHEGDQYAATRCAIVRAAAALCPSS
jgi:uncharacterized protein YmfQ (DUF2313 family)